VLSKLKKQSRIVQLLFLLVGVSLILYTLFLASAPVLRGDIGFNTDLARDFLLLENMQEEKKPTLLGPRSGGIPGLFHGPLWIYLNLPAFLLGQGNPVAVGWFWIGLVALLVGVVFYVGRKLFDVYVGMIAAVLVALHAGPSASTLFNPFGAVIVTPLFFYFLFKYLTEHKMRDLIISLFLIGIIIQFQMAFGGPVLILTTLLVGYFIIKRKQLKHFLSFFILFIPLATFILFDVRHDFLQLNAILNYLQSDSGSVKDFSFMSMLQNRTEGIINSLSGIYYPPVHLQVFIGGIYALLLYKAFKNRKEKSSQFIFLFSYIFIGYWIITFLFKGIIWTYYYWPFMPMALLLIASSYKLLNKYVSAIVIVFVFIFLLQHAQTYAFSRVPAAAGKDGGSWLFNYNMAEKVFDQGDSSFGYYIFSPDQYGYSLRYAMNYAQKKHPEVQVAAYEKKDITYLLISPPGGDNKSIGGQWWKENKVNIKRAPDKVIPFESGFIIEQYKLRKDEQTIPSDPNLIDSLIFR
jgi:hypothetical protein